LVGIPQPEVRRCEEMAHRCSVSEQWGGTVGEVGGGGEGRKTE